MDPAAAADCITSPEDALPTPARTNWTPFTVVENQFFDNDCLTRFYLNTLSPTASCLSGDNICMIERALQDALELNQVAIPDLAAPHSDD